VEIGQVLIILTIVPLLFVLKSDKILKIISIIGAMMATLWIINRIFSLGVMPF